jgi:hypothetical protein
VLDIKGGEKFGDNGERPAKRSRLSVENSEDIGEDNEVAFSNPGINVATYSEGDGLQMKEMVIITVLLPSGCNSCKFQVDPDGYQGTLTYAWPNFLAHVEPLFQADLEDKKIANYHPMIVALKKTMTDHTDSVNKAPTTSVSIDFPIQVQPANEQIKKSVVSCKSSGAMVFIAKLKGLESVFSTNDDALQIENFNSFNKQ